MLATEVAGQPAGRRRGDGRSHDIRGQHPGDLVLGRRQRALHVRQGDVGDGRVDHLHQGRQHDRDDQQRQVVDLAMGGVR